MRSKVISSILSTVTAIVLLAMPITVFAAPANAPNGGTIQQRIALRKTEQNVKLDSKELARLKGRCVPAQTAAREIQENFGKIIADRQAIYKTVDAKLWIVIGKLKLANTDTFGLEKQRAEFAKKVEANTNTLNQYKQTLDDLVVMNCEADLNGFIAVLKTAREYHTLLRGQSAEIKTYVVDTIKKNLSAIATDLQPKASTEKENNGSQ